MRERKKERERNRERAGKDKVGLSEKEKRGKTGER